MPPAPVGRSLDATSVVILPMRFQCIALAVAGKVRAADAPFRAMVGRQCVRDVIREFRNHDEFSKETAVAIAQRAAEYAASEP
jgi:hypothetical protein